MMGVVEIIREITEYTCPRTEDRLDTGNERAK